MILTGMQRKQIQRIAAEDGKAIIFERRYEDKLELAWTVAGGGSGTLLTMGTSTEDTKLFELRSIVARNLLAAEQDGRLTSSELDAVAGVPKGAKLVRRSNDKHRVLHWVKGESEGELVRLSMFTNQEVFDVKVRNVREALR